MLKRLGMMLSAISLADLATVTGGADYHAGLPGHSFTKTVDGVSIACSNSNPSVTKPDWQCTVRATDHQVVLRPGKPLVTKGLTNTVTPSAPES